MIRTFRCSTTCAPAITATRSRATSSPAPPGPVDLLEVLFLMKECRLSRAGGADARLRIVPLFEAGDTLAAAAHTMRTVLAVPCYRRALAAVHDEQEIMLGYSDSNKDVGYTASGWGIYRGQLELSEAMREHGLTWIFFHGRAAPSAAAAGRASSRSARSHRARWAGA